MENNLALIKPYYKSELAELFGQNLRTFSDIWIGRDRILQQILSEFGFKLGNKHLTQKQVEIIFDYFYHPQSKNNDFIQTTTERVYTIPYKMNELAKMYYITVPVLKEMLRTLPKEDYDYIYATEVYKNSIEYNMNKKYFTVDELKLIFNYFGHPFKQ